jgi:hypothetical protein
LAWAEHQHHTAATGSTGPTRTNRDPPNDHNQPNAPKRSQPAINRQHQTPNDGSRLKARATIALGDCFAAVTEAAHGLTLLTGDPELLELPDAPCQLEDIRMPYR